MLAALLLTVPANAAHPGDTILIADNSTAADYALARYPRHKFGPDMSKSLCLHYSAQDHVTPFPRGISDDAHLSELGARQVADLVADGLKSLALPISAKIADPRPALTRTAALGRTDCQ